MKNFSLVKHQEQFLMFTHMTELLKTGSLALPRQVAAEMTHIRYADVPGSWASGCQPYCVYPQPSDESMAEVLGVAQLVDVHSERENEEADPYVVAMAYEIGERYPMTRVVVVSDDIKDRLPLKESVQTACDRLGIDCECSADFVSFLRAIP